MVCPEIEDVDNIICSNEFIVIRPNNKKDSYFIAGALRTDTILKYLYSKCRGATPSRYWLSRDDMKSIPFPVPEESKRQALGDTFKKSLDKYIELTNQAENEITTSYEVLEKSLT